MQQPCALTVFNAVAVGSVHELNPKRVSDWIAAETADPPAIKNKSNAARTNSLGESTAGVLVKFSTQQQVVQEELRQLIGNRVKSIIQRDQSNSKQQDFLNYLFINYLFVIFIWD